MAARCSAHSRWAAGRCSSRKTRARCCSRRGMMPTASTTLSVIAWTAQRVFATQVGQRCHDIINHPTLPIALFVARRPGTESYLIDLRDGALLQTITSNANRHFYGHAVIHKSGDWLYATENDTSDPGRGLLGCVPVRRRTAGAQRRDFHPWHRPAPGGVDARRRNPGGGQRRHPHRSRKPRGNEPQRHGAEPGADATRRHA